MPGLSNLPRLVEESDASDTEADDLCSTVALSSATVEEASTAVAATAQATELLSTLSLRSQVSRPSAGFLAARTHGLKELACPSKTGETRYRFTHHGVVYISDETCQREICHWSLADNADVQGPPIFGALAGYASHVVIVVDHSGSMRKDDVDGHPTRTHAVYDTLRREFLQPQLDQLRKSGGVGLGDAFVSLVQVVVFFLSDGAPSDHIDRKCSHGIKVWEAQPGVMAYYHGRYKEQLNQCPYGVTSTCRQQVHSDVRHESAAIVRRLQQKFGDGRFVLHTVAFGNPRDDFEVLRQMALVHPSFSFQKLGLFANRLGMAFTTLTDTLTTMRTASVGHAGLSLRAARSRESAEQAREIVREVTAPKWDIYTLAKRSLNSKMAFDIGEDTFVDKPLEHGAVGVAICHEFFAQGSERAAHRCTEIRLQVDQDGKTKLVATGPPLVAKDTLFREELLNGRYHHRIARDHGTGDRLATIFNARIAAAYGQEVARSMSVRFAPCWIYEVKDSNYEGGVAWILAEPRLDGVYTKWNNNAGKVSSVNKAGLPEGGLVQLVPQAFSHFTWSVENGKKLLCDLQGVWNAKDGFTFTDPAVHRHETSRKSRKRKTDKGSAGMRAFFDTHVCSELCTKLGLKPYPSASMHHLLL